MFTFIVLDGLKKVDGERSPAAIYHILTGKRSSQTIQDAHIFQLKNYFGIYKTLGKRSFNEQALFLEREGLIQLEQKRGILTEYGMKFLNHPDMQEQVDKFKGLDYDRIANVFFDRLSLFIQLASNLLSGQSDFIPISDNSNTLNWTKRYYRAKKLELTNCFDNLYRELTGFLLTLDEEEASVFVDRLSGYNRFGLSKPQISNKYGLSGHDTELLLILLVHKLITWIREKKQQSLVMADFLSDVNQRSLNTESAEKTYELLEKGFTIKEISKIRNLRESTIHDHIIEIAYRQPDFDVSPYLDRDEFEEIAGAVDFSGAKKLKALKDATAGKYSYFQLRLVLAIQAQR